MRKVFGVAVLGIGASAGSCGSCRSTRVPINERWILADDEVDPPSGPAAAVGRIEWPLPDRQDRLGGPRTTPARPLVSAAMTSARANGPQCGDTDLRRARIKHDWDW